MSENRPESIEKYLNYYLGSEYASVVKNFIMNNQLSIRYFNLFCHILLLKAGLSNSLLTSEQAVFASVLFDFALRKRLDKQN